MKNNLLTCLILIGISVAGNAQSFLQEGKTWNIVQCLGFGGCWTESFQISGDTVMNGFEYKNLNWTNDTTLSIWNPYGAMREVGDNVFFYFYQNETEELLYDFSLNIGEVYSGLLNTAKYGDCPYDLEVLSIDTIVIANGEERQRINFTDSESWIEGLGSTLGLIYPGAYYCVTDISFDLNCCHESGNLIYQFDFFDACLVETLNTNNFFGIDYNIFPNPFQDAFTLETYSNTGEFLSIEIWNLQGQKVISNVQISSAQHRISTQNLPAGVYIYKLTDQQNRYVVGKLIKE